MQDWKEDLWMKRFIRDHVRYIDEIQCAAARVVHALREHAKKRDPTTNPNGIYDSFHIRRGDFQFKTTRVDADVIYDRTKEELAPNSTIYIATDERDKKFFQPLRDHYDILFLDDFEDALQGINTNYYGVCCVPLLLYCLLYLSMTTSLLNFALTCFFVTNSTFLGMIDQLVASRGRIFFGCFYSTFTGYINRIRGYHSQNAKAPGYEMGELPTTYYYATPEKKLIMHKYAPLRGGFFNRVSKTMIKNISHGYKK